MTPKGLERAWEGAKTVQNWWDPYDVLAAGAANTIDAIVPTSLEELFIDLVGMSSRTPVGYYGTKVGRKAFKALTDLRIRGLDDTAGLTPALADGAEFGIKYSTPPVKPSTSPVKLSNPLAISKTATTAAKVINTSKAKNKRVLLTEAEKRAKRRANSANRRFREAVPSDDDLLSEFRRQGIPEELIPVYKKNAKSSWARTKKAASLQTVETHAGHQRNLLSSGDPLEQGINKLDTTATTGRTAKLEYGPDNLKKGAREGSMNQYVADITGMPSNWRKDIKQWHQHYRGEPSLHYNSDWTVEQMDMLEAIPENWSKSKVMGRIEEIKQQTPTTAGQQYKSIQKELSEEVLRESDLLENHYSAD